MGVTRRLGGVLGITGVVEHRLPARFAVTLGEELVADLQDRSLQLTSGLLQLLGTLRRVDRDRRVGHAAPVEQGLARTADLAAGKREEFHRKALRRFLGCDRKLVALDEIAADPLCLYILRRVGREAIRVDDVAVLVDVPINLRLRQGAGGDESRGDAASH